MTFTFGKDQIFQIASDTVQAHAAAKLLKNILL
jgi:hypothetical protein